MDLYANGADVDPEDVPQEMQLMHNSIRTAILNCGIEAGVIGGSVGRGCEGSAFKGRSLFREPVRADTRGRCDDS